MGLFFSGCLRCAAGERGLRRRRGGAALRPSAAGVSRYGRRIGMWRRGCRRCGHGRFDASLGSGGGSGGGQARPGGEAAGDHCARLPGNDACGAGERRSAGHGGELPSRPTQPIGACRPRRGTAGRALPEDAASELLLQSYGEVIRLFPAWPRDKAARFTSLRAEGGFLVSASLEGGEISSTTIHSTVGGTCQLRSPWPAVAIREEERAVPCTQEGDTVSFATQPGQTYLVERA